MIDYIKNEKKDIKTIKYPTTKSPTHKHSNTNPSNNDLKNCDTTSRKKYN